MKNKRNKNKFTHKLVTTINDNYFRVVAVKVLKTFLVIFLVIAFFMFSTGLVYLFQVANDKVEYDVKASKLLLSSIVYINGEDGSTKEYTRAYDTENRIWADFDKIPKHMKDAIIAIEDKRFFEHSGVDWIRTAGAAINLVTGSDTYGGSTLTQQLIKNLTGENQTSITRKVKEIFRALNFESENSKQQI